MEHLLEALRYKKEGRVFDCRWCIFHCHNPPGRTMALSSAQPLREMNTSNISWGVQAVGKTKNRWWNCVQSDINKCKITNWKGRSINRTDLEKSIKEAKVRTGL